VSVNIKQITLLRECWY